ncbi:MAG: LytTR family DNA-binding domain-containing protein [Cyclobacteriaceae bacterium]
MINAKSEFSKFLVYSTVFLLVIFLILMGQNVIRYGTSDHYNPVRSFIYLAFSVLLFIPLVPIGYALGRRALAKRAKYYWLIAVLLAVSILFIFLLISNIALYLSGHYDHAFDLLYVQRYFGREALFHLILLMTCFYFVKTRALGKLKLVSATLGRKEITISTDLIRWIESDDHYLKIHTEESSLMKRTTLEQMAEELKPNFVRIHRKYIVNKNQIIGKEKKQRDEFVILKSGERLKVGRSYVPFHI